MIPHSEEQKRKMSEAHKGKVSGMKGKKHSEETKARMAQAHIGKKHSEETIEKMRAKRAEYWKNQKNDDTETKIELKLETKRQGPGFIGGLKIATYKPKN